jgi:hypothetical protein
MDGCGLPAPPNHDDPGAALRAELLFGNGKTKSNFMLHTRATKKPEATTKPETTTRSGAGKWLPIHVLDEFLRCALRQRHKNLLREMKWVAWPTTPKE